MDTTATGVGKRENISMPSTIYISGSINIGIALTSMIEVGLDCTIKVSKA